MDRLNYFNPYDSKEPHHEDQLTRAYLVLLKHSSHAFFAFFEYCRTKLSLKTKNEKPISLIDFIEDSWIIETQKNNPNIDTNFLLSVLITGENVKNDKSIKSSRRNARYDGIITFGSELTMIIENKPKSNNIWFDQLNPSKQNLMKETIIYKNSVILEWKQIIKHLNYLHNLPTITGYEKIMIDDFFSFINEEHSYLNPYDNLSLCRNNKYLLSKRVNDILKSIAFNSQSIKEYNKKGGYIETQFEQIKQIRLELEVEKERIWLKLAMCFGDTQEQARNFFGSKPDISKIKKLEDCDWEIWCNFHVSYQAKNLVWFDSEVEIVEYIEYWLKNIDLIYQHKKNEVKSFLNKLKKEKIIIYNEEEKTKLKEDFFDTARDRLNICPGFVIWYYFPLHEAAEKDKKGELAKDIIEKIKEGLTAFDLDWKKVINQKLPN